MLQTVSSSQPLDTIAQKTESKVRQHLKLCAAAFCIGLTVGGIFLAFSQSPVAAIVGGLLACPVGPVGAIIAGVSAFRESEERRLLEIGMQASQEPNSEAQHTEAKRLLKATSSL